MTARTSSSAIHSATASRRSGSSRGSRAPVSIAGLRRAMSAPAADWAEEIIEAISGARVMVLVFSASTNDSPQVRREVERAVHQRVAVLPFRIEDVLPSQESRVLPEQSALAGCLSATARTALHPPLRAPEQHAGVQPRRLWREAVTDCDRAAPSPAPPAGARALDPAQLRRFETKLADFIGPLARPPGEARRGERREPGGTHREARHGDRVRDRAPPVPQAPAGSSGGAGNSLRHGVHRPHADSRGIPGRRRHGSARAARAARRSGCCEAGIDANLAHPSPRAKVASAATIPAFFLEDFCCWQENERYRSFIFESALGEAGAPADAQRSARLYHDHMLTKEPGTRAAHALAPGPAVLQHQRAAELQLLDSGRPGAAASRRSSSSPARTSGRGSCRAPSWTRRRSGFPKGASPICRTSRPTAARIAASSAGPSSPAMPCAFTC